MFMKYIFPGNVLVEVIVYVRTQAYHSGPLTSNQIHLYLLLPIVGFVTSHLKLVTGNNIQYFDELFYRLSYIKAQKAHVKKYENRSIQLNPLADLGISMNVSGNVCHISQF